MVIHVVHVHIPRLFSPITRGLSGCATGRCSGGPARTRLPSSSRARCSGSPVPAIVARSPMSRTYGGRRMFVIISLIIPIFLFTLYLFFIGPGIRDIEYL